MHTIFSSSSPPSLIYSPVWFVCRTKCQIYRYDRSDRPSIPAMRHTRFKSIKTTFMLAFFNKMYINNLKAFIKIFFLDKSRIAQNECHAFSLLSGLHNSLVTRLLKPQIASANKRRYQRAQIVISKFLHFTVRVAHIHSHGHKFKNKSSHALEDTCNSITCRYTGKGCAQVNTQSPSLPLCHTRAHTLIL